MFTCTNNFENSVKVLGVISDNRLTCTEHTSICCKKVARQLNASSRVAKYFWTWNLGKSPLATSSWSIFDYCPLGYYFGGKSNYNKLEQIQEWSLRTLLSDASLNHKSLDTFCTMPLLTWHLKYMTLQALRLIRQENAACLHDMSHVNEVPYEMRFSK